MVLIELTLCMTAAQVVDCLREAGWVACGFALSCDAQGLPRRSWEHRTTSVHQSLKLNLVACSFQPRVRLMNEPVRNASLSLLHQPNDGKLCVVDQQQ